MDVGLFWNIEYIPSKIIKMRPIYPRAMKVFCHVCSRISASGFPKMIPTAIWPIMPARITFAETHSAKDRKKKNEMIIRISTTRTKGVC